MLLTVREEATLETGPPGVEVIALDPGIFQAGAIEGAMPSEAAGVDLTDRERVPTAIAAHRAWGLAAEDLAAEAAEAVAAEVGAADGADSGDGD